MLCRSTWRGNRYVAVVGRAFLVEYLYGSKHSPHLGVYPMPYVYIKAVLLCAASDSLGQAERRQLHSMIEALMPVHSSQDHLAQEELLSFVDAAKPSCEVTEHDEESEEGAARGGDDCVEGATSSDASAKQRVAADEDAGEDGIGGGDRQEVLASSSSWCALEACDPLASMLSPATFPSRVARVLIYDAVSTCVARGTYTAGDRERVALVSARIGLSSAVREQIEALVLQERALARRRCAQLHLQPCCPSSHISAAGALSRTRTGHETGSSERPSAATAAAGETAEDDSGSNESDAATCRPPGSSDATQPSSSSTPPPGDAGDTSDNRQVRKESDGQGYTLSFADMKRILRLARSRRPKDG